MFADDNYLIEASKDLYSVKNKLELTANRVYNWLKRSGMSTNLQKTELIIFNPKKSFELTKLSLSNQEISNKKNMKVLGIIFDYKLTWTDHIQMAKGKTKRACFGLKRLSTFLDPIDLLNLTSPVAFSRLYYGAPIWLNRQLHNHNIQNLLRASTNILKSCFRLGDWNHVSFADLHEISNKATPMMYGDYQQAIMLKNIITNKRPENVWLKLQMNIREHVRENRIYFTNESLSPIGTFSFANKIRFMSSRLPPNWEVFTDYMLKSVSKRLFLKF